MTDLELTKLCAEAMRLNIADDAEPIHFWQGKNPLSLQRYDPLHDDAQTMALFWWLISECYKRHWSLSIDGYLRIWTDERDAGEWDAGFGPISSEETLRRSIVECVAKMQEAKHSEHEGSRRGKR